MENWGDNINILFGFDHGPEEGAERYKGFFVYYTSSLTQLYYLIY